MSLQTTHNTTTTSLQREVDQLRQSHQQLKIQMRELEMGNDDLERNERAVSSSLADVESKYSKALEEKILLEHELLDKANVEEECQRLKDEIRGTVSQEVPLCPCSHNNISLFSLRSRCQPRNLIIERTTHTSKSLCERTDACLNNGFVVNFYCAELQATDVIAR